MKDRAEEQQMRTRKLVFIISIILCVIVAFLRISLAQKINTLAGLLGTLITIVVFLEPITNQIRLWFFKEYVITNRLKIYNAVIENIRSAKSNVRFKTPTTSWGCYSAGTHIYEQTVTEIKQAVARGVTVRLIADIYDWERAIYAMGLIQAGAKIVYSKTVHDYYVIVDEDVLITMGTESTPTTIDFLGRLRRRMEGTAIVSAKPIPIAGHIKKFDEEWGRNSNDVNDRITDYIHSICPCCNNKLEINFNGDQIALKNTQ